MAFGFGLDHAEGFAIHEKGEIRFTRGKGNLADGDAGSGGEVGFVLGLDKPARCGELRVNCCASFLFRGHTSNQFACKVSPEVWADEGRVASGKWRAIRTAKRVAGQDDRMDGTPECLTSSQLGRPGVRGRK